MEATKISYIKDNIYIPPATATADLKLPSHHPSLILPDYHVDVSHQAKCGCKGDKCITKEASWLYGPNGEIKHVKINDINSTEGMLFKNLIHDGNGRQL